MQEQAAVQVWFDSQCPLCRKEIAFMRRLDWRNRVLFTDIFTADQCPLEPSQLLARFHAQARGASLVSGAAAFAVLWRHLPLLRPLGELARIPWVLALLERAYIRFLRVRPKLQKLLGGQA